MSEPQHAWQWVKAGLLGLPLACLALAPAAFADPAPQAVVSDAEITKILTDRIDVQKRSVGIVIGILQPQGRHIVAYGHPEVGDARSVDGNTVYEIGSNSKVFTALLLAQMDGTGEVHMNDPVQKYLPSGVKMPQHGAQQITLADLATHLSGLPRMPTNFHPKDPANPYADYTEQQLFDFLSSYELPRDIGAKYEYSNLAFGLLGDVLSRQAKSSYETLVLSRICKPLGMKDTRITLTPDMTKRLAMGHNGDLQTVANWDLAGAMAGAGAIRSTANDMMIFLAAAMDYKKTSLSPAFHKLTVPHGGSQPPVVEIGLGWTLDKRDDGFVVWKNGGTAGYRTFMGYNPETKLGIVAFSNSGVSEGVDDIGLHLLNPKHALLVHAAAVPDAKVAPQTLDRYVGRYTSETPGAVAGTMEISRDGDRLFMAASSAPRSQLHASADGSFHSNVNDITITFEQAGDAPAKGVTIKTGDQTIHAARQP